MGTSAMALTTQAGSTQQIDNLSNNDLPNDEFDRIRTSFESAVWGHLALVITLPATPTTTSA